MCHLRGAINIPYDGIANGAAQAELEALQAKLEAGEQGKPKHSCYVICRRGNDSKSVTALLRSMGLSDVYNVRGGLNQWAREVDQSCPFY